MNPLPALLFALSGAAAAQRIVLSVPSSAPSIVVSPAAAAALTSVIAPAAAPGAFFAAPLSAVAAAPALAASAAPASLAAAAAPAPTAATPAAAPAAVLAAVAKTVDDIPAVADPAAARADQGRAFDGSAKASGAGSTAAGPLLVEGVPLQSVLQTQGWLFGILSRRTGQDPLVLNMALNLFREGLSVEDYARVLKELTAIGADHAEVEEALLRTTAHTPFARPLGPQNQPAFDDYLTVTEALRELPRQVEILRNNRFMAWTYDLAAGRPTPEFAPAPRVQRLPNGEWRVRLGYLNRGGRAEVVAVLNTPRPGEAPSLAYFLDPVFASPRLDPALRAALSGVAQELARQGVQAVSRP